MFVVVRDNFKLNGLITENFELYELDKMENENLDHQKFCFKLWNKKL